LLSNAEGEVAKVDETTAEWETGGGTIAALVDTAPRSEAVKTTPEKAGRRGCLFSLALWLDEPCSDDEKVCLTCNAEGTKAAVTDTSNIKAKSIMVELSYIPFLRAVFLLSS